MSNRIEIKVDKAITGLAGYDYGKKIFMEQAADKIDFNDKIIIVFPENIQRMASSFIQGFFEEIVKNIGISGIEANVEIQSGNEKLKNIILDNLI